MINRFVQQLGKVQVTSTVDNFYNKSQDNYFKKRSNLRLYLNQMVERQPQILLVGEAPGYRGCKLTGVPFSSERVLIEERPPFGKSAGYQLIRPTDKPMSESSATIVWETLWNQEIEAVCWNAYPFHPHHINKRDSNRKPNNKELQEGRYFLKRIIQIFKPKHVVAVGHSAAKALGIIGVKHQHIRHPSYGGKADFVAGIKAL